MEEGMYHKLFPARVFAKGSNKKKSIFSICPKANASTQRQNIWKDVFVSRRKVQNPVQFQNGSNHFQLQNKAVWNLHRSFS